MASQRRFVAEYLVPGVLVTLGVALLVAWSAASDVEGLEARVPHMDRPVTDSSAAVEPVVIEGKVTRSDGVPADIPGSWPGFRGAQHDGIVRDETPLARSWPEGGPKALWDLELGEGYAGAAVHAGCVYLVDYDAAGSADVIRSLSLADGREIWRYSYPVRIKRHHGMSRTIPTVTDRHVVSIGPKCHVACLDRETGEKRWFIDLVGEYGTKVPQWYGGQCPLVDGDRVILAPGGSALLLAVGLEDGKVVWETPNPRRWAMTHSSITAITVDGVKMYVYPAKRGVVGVAADDGRLLWETTDWKIGIATVPTPVDIGDGRVFLSGGYNAGSLMLRVVKEGDAFRAETLFRLEAKVFGATQQTPVFHDGHIYGIRPDGQFTCLDLEGQAKWESGAEHRFGLGPFTVAGDLLYALDDEGHLTLAQISPGGFRALATARVLEGHEAWGPLALVSGRLLARDLTRMVCLDVRSEP